MTRTVTCSRAYSTLILLLCPIDIQRPALVASLCMAKTDWELQLTGTPCCPGARHTEWCGRTCELQRPPAAAGVQLFSSKHSPVLCMLQSFDELIYSRADEPPERQCRCSGLR
jgi:hypothetical protein